MMSTRPRLLQSAILVAVLAIGGIATYKFYDQTRVRTIRIATSKDGLSRTAGETLAKIAARESPRLRLEIVKSEGSADAMRLLHEGKVELAFASNDTPAVPEARLVAFPYASVFHLIVPQDAPIRNVTDLKGKRVGTPSVGGGSYNSFLTLIHYYDVKPGEFASFQNLSSSELPVAFLRGDLDAMFGSDPIGIDRQKKALETGLARLVPLDEAPAMRLSLPYIEAVTVPKGAYKANPPVPAEDLPSIAIQTSLLAHRNLNAQTVRKITRMLFDYRFELSQAAPQLTALCAPPPSNSLGIAVHEGALSYYNRDKPGFLQEYSSYLGYIGLLITFTTMGISASLAMRSRLARKQKSRADQYNQEIVELMGEIHDMTRHEQLSMAERKLFDMFKRVVDDLDHDRLIGDTVGSFMLTWEQAMQSARHRQLMCGPQPALPGQTASLSPP